MNAIDNRRVVRAQATKRLRRITIGTAVLGVAATAGFGTLAATTYAGASPAATTTTTTAASTRRDQNSSGGIASAVSGLLGGTTGAAHATSGGS